MIQNSDFKKNALLVSTACQEVQLINEPNIKFLKVCGKTKISAHKQVNANFISSILGQNKAVLANFKY